MTLEQLRIFVAVAEREHVTRAAEALNLTQSATSAAVAALEQRYQMRLFDRVGRRIELTEAGRQFLVEARAVLARAAAAEQVLADLAGLKRGTVRLTASQTVGNYWLPSLMARFQQAYPQIRLPLSIGNTEQVARTVEEGSAELGFIEGQINAPILRIEPVADDRLALVVGRDHPWTVNPPHHWSDLPASRWVVREAGSGTRSIFETALLAHGLSLSQFDVAMELPSIEAVIAAVSAGAGATVISELAATPALASGAVTRIPFDMPMRRFFLVHHAERHLGVAARAFMEAATSGAK